MTASTITIELPLWRAKKAALAVLPHVSTDDVTPVLTVAQVTGGYLLGTDRYSVGRFTLQDDDTPPTQDPGSLTARIPAETDKHFAARLKDWQAQHEVWYFADGERTTDTQEMLVPVAALRRISTLSHALLPSGKVMQENARVRIEGYEPRVVGISGRERKGHEWVDVALIDATGRTVLRQTFMGVIGNFPPVGRLLDEWAPAEDGGTLNFTAWNLAKMTRFAEKHEVIRLTPGKPREGEKAHRLAPTRLEVGKDFVALLQPNLAL